jgi:hypothetical protein
MNRHSVMKHDSVIKRHTGQNVTVYEITVDETSQWTSIVH